MKEYKRLDTGLLDGVEYSMNEDGTVNWRKMIRPEHIVINRQYKSEIEKKLGQPCSEISPTELDDKYLLILLQGFKELAQIRGFTNLNYIFNHCTQSFVSVTCSIEWLKNFETHYVPIRFESCADASKDNTMSWYAKYLTAAAENRAFVRNVRNFLRIPIIGFDEIGPMENGDSEQPNPADPYTILESMMKGKNISFDKLKAALMAANMEGASAWNEVKDIPKAKMFEIIGKINK